jgi:hypothetical protein
VEFKIYYLCIFIMYSYRPELFAVFRRKGKSANKLLLKKKLNFPLVEQKSRSGMPYSRVLSRTNCIQLLRFYWRNEIHDRRFGNRYCILLLASKHCGWKKDTGRHARTLQDHTSYSSNQTELGLYTGT